MGDGKRFCGSMGERRNDSKRVPEMCHFQESFKQDPTLFLSVTAVRVISWVEMGD